MSQRAFLLIALATAAETARAQSPESFDRIRAELARSPTIDLSVADPAMHFHVEVQERRFFRDIPLIWDIRPGPIPAPTSALPGTPALIQVDLLPIGRHVASAVGKAKHARAARLAHEEAEEALREFCADRECDPPSRDR